MTLNLSQATSGGAEIHRNVVEALFRQALVEDDISPLNSEKVEGHKASMLARSKKKARQYFSGALLAALFAIFLATSGLLHFFPIERAIGMALLFTCIFLYGALMAISHKTDRWQEVSLRDFRQGGHWVPPAAMFIVGKVRSIEAEGVRVELFVSYFADDPILTAKVFAVDDSTETPLAVVHLFCWDEKGEEIDLR